ncbi:demethylmenaquinone methyltransferase/2-methoxy-6-polyprenyl-1,4-benzoquinol methylase [Arcanobacterium wilhelmae]|uniref:Demethylmenaquinone methyltransferase n=1 Tax=Arcanobacterium wilhelmae TaxID=1803177 RepID=A0ABT9NA25_9ACTO|nr:class I SAM-dependent methyltransferase [Arcanobacterium wilhelmae]MDP9800560.1 demethylmenaquinone methyltransferase/2-methoxy-6-polyprenyl-1,4-benzoquinol methylase [Arcanobacterium wilhelmae]WFN89974.1 class I SAM-dependent methyltransferase [Arcanobacterium wilhelmae]
MLSMKRATLEKNPGDVSSMFDDVAAKYDLMNTVLTGGQVYGWRRTTTVAIDPKPGEKILDLAAGTGTSSAEYAKAGAEVVALDFSAGMIEEGRRRYPHLNFVQGDAMDLPFEDNTFDAVTISYGLRNVNDPHKALAEMYRVVKPGGRLVVAEFSQPQNAAFNQLYRFFSDQIMPLMAKFSSDPPAYDYLVESIRKWPAQREFAQWVAAAGWRGVEYKNMSGGIVALHRAWK